TRRRREAYAPRRGTRVRGQQPPGGARYPKVRWGTADLARPGRGGRPGQGGHLDREAAYKTRNLRRDPRVVLCVLSDDFFGPWIQIEGTAQIVSLPEGMPGLVGYYRGISGGVPR